VQIRIPNNISAVINDFRLINQLSLWTL
jgi:hypothetical protein